MRSCRNRKPTERVLTRDDCQNCRPVSASNKPVQRGRRTFATQTIHTGQYILRPFTDCQPVRCRRRGMHVVAASNTANGSKTRQNLTEVSADELEVVQSNLPGQAVKLTVTVPPTVCKRCYNTSMKNLRKVVGSVRGFPANQPLPEAVVAAKIGGETNFRMAMVEEILLATYEVVMNRYRSVAIDGSDRILSKAPEIAATFNIHTPVVYEIAFDMVPSVKWKSSYKSLAVTIQDTGSGATDEEAAADLIRQMLKEKGSQRVVADRGLEHKDVALIDMEIRQAGSSKPLPGLKKEMFVLDTEADPLGLSRHMEGMQPGDERNFRFTFPQDWHMALWQGMPAEGRIKVHELFSWRLPEFDDAFVAKHFPQLETAERMRKTLVAQTAKQRFEQRDRDLRESFFKELVSIVDLEVPDQLVQETGEQQYMAQLMEMVAQGQAKPEQLDELATEEKLEEYVANNRPDLVDMVKLQLACEEIFRSEGLKVDEKQLLDEIKVAVEDFKAREMDFDLDRVREQAYEGLKAMAIMEWVKEHCQVTIQPWADQTTA